jgi:hypothetical protein
MRFFDKSLNINEEQMHLPNIALYWAASSLCHESRNVSSGEGIPNDDVKHADKNVPSYIVFLLHSSNNHIHSP